MTEQAGVIFRPLVENLAQDKQRRWFGEPRMVDCGDHVEYFDGKRTFSWRLPDQTGDYPVVSQVLIAAFTTALGGTVAHYRVNFLDPSDALLGTLNFRPRVYAEHADAVLPDTALQPLADRGVQIVRKQYRDGAQFHREYPDVTPDGASRSFAVHPVLWIGGAFLVLIIVVNLILLATGYYR